MGGERSPDTVYEHVQASPEFAELRSRLRRFVFPMSAAFLLWYLIFVLLASYAPGLMAVPVLGNINVGLILGLLQFVSTFAIATLLKDLGSAADANSVWEIELARRVGFELRDIVFTGVGKSSAELECANRAPQVAFNR